MKLGRWEIYVAPRWGWDRKVPAEPFLLVGVYHVGPFIVIEWAH